MPTRSPLTITIADLRARRVCNLPQHIAAVEAHLCRSVGDNESIPLATWVMQAPYAADLIWILSAHSESAPIAAEIALRAAERAAQVSSNVRDMCAAIITMARGYVAGTVSRDDLQTAIDAAITYAQDATADGAVNAAVYAADAVYHVSCDAETVYVLAAHTTAYASSAAADAVIDAAYAADGDAETDAAIADAADDALNAERAAQRADLLALLME